MTSDYPIVTTTHGDIKGIKRTALYGEEYFSFERIPYAQPPLGDLRFKAPLPIAPWTHLLDCTETANKPLQKNPFTGVIEGTEDCLFLNVYARTLKNEKRLPVLIYIYGGAFKHGEATRARIAPDYFMQEDVILVTMNYRLDALGFLCLNDPDLSIPGNAGLKDQLAAVRWFKQNCKKFNGDPENITLFGESAGGASTHYLMLNAKSKGLIHKAIIMSGAVYNKWADVTRSDYAYRLAKVNGYTGNNNDKDVYNFLVNVKGDDLLVHDIRTAEERENDISFVFGPTVEPYITPDCIIAETPAELVRKSWSNAIPIMIGGTSFEGLLRYPTIKDNPDELRRMMERPELLIPAELRKQRNLAENREIGINILKLHLGDADLSFENIMKYLDIMSYKFFWHALHRTILMRFKYATAPTYFYRFDFDSPTFNFYRLKYCGPAIRGVAHADDLSYLFYCNAAWKLEKDSDEYKTIRRMVGMWTAFAKNSNPNCKQIEPAVWTPVKASQPYRCLNISTKVEVMDYPEAEKLAFWTGLFDN